MKILAGHGGIGMVRSLLQLLLIIALGSAIARPLHAQQVFLDLNQDAVCDANDIPAFSAVDTIDVWIDTSTNQDGSPAVCGTGEELTVAAYEVILRTDAGTAILSWTNSRPEFTVEVQKTIQAGAMWVSYSSQTGSTHLAPGKYLLGRAGYQRTSGCLYFQVVFQEPSLPSAETKFYSRCLGIQQDNFVRLGSDFHDSCGTNFVCTGIKPTTWGRIKEIYR